jgi:peptidase E
VKRLLLGSFGIGALPTLAEGDLSRLRVAYVPTAAGPDAEAQFWVKADREQLSRLGCITVTLDLARAEPDLVRRTNESRRSGFIDLVPPRVRNGELIYVGTSSGAMLAEAPHA